MFIVLWFVNARVNVTKIFFLSFEKDSKKDAEVLYRMFQ